jgi:hypothetical protein
VLAGCEDDLADRNHALLADGLADHRERLLSDLTVGHNVIRIVEIELVDFLARHELVNVDHALALDGNRFKFLWVKLEVLPLADFVPFDDVGAFDLVSALGVNLISSKRLGSRYRSGRSLDWLKFKNPQAPALPRESKEDWQRAPR